MAMSLPDGELIDPVRRSADLDARVLRTPLSPAVSLSDDPLRMLRSGALRRRLRTRRPKPRPRPRSARCAIGSPSCRASVYRDELDKLLSVTDPIGGFVAVAAHGAARRVHARAGGRRRRRARAVVARCRWPRRSPRRAVRCRSPTGAAATARAAGSKYSARRGGDSSTPCCTPSTRCVSLERVDAPAVRRLVRARRAPALDDATRAGQRHHEPARVAAMRDVLEQLAPVEDLASTRTRARRRRGATGARHR